MVRVRLRSIHKEFAGKRGRVAVEHASLDGRWIEALTAIAMTRGGSTVLFTDQRNRVAYCLARWFEASKVRLKRWTYEGGVIWDAGKSRLVVLDPDANLGSIPLGAVDRWFVVNAHQLNSNPLPRETMPAESIVCGELADRGHWFFRLARTDQWEPVRIPWDPICKDYPDQKQFLPDRSTHSFQRRFEVLDVVIPQMPTHRFAPSRLRIETDKPPHYLSQAQLAEALEQFPGGWGASMGGLPIVRFELSPLQRRYMAMKRLGRARGFRKFICVKARRMGVSSVELAESYQMAVTRPRSRVLTVAHRLPTTLLIFKAASVFAREDPARPALVGESTDRISFASGSVLLTGTAGSVGLARGETISRTHLTEVSRWCEDARDRDAAVRGLLSGILAAGQNAEHVLESTPNGRDPFWSLYKSAMDRTNDFFPIFLRWFDDPAYRMPAGSFNPEEIRDTLKEDERQLIERHGLGLDQIAFRRKQAIEHGSLALQEFPEDDQSCFITSGFCYFSVQCVLALQSRAPDLPRTHIPGGYFVQAKKPIEGRSYVAGADCSEGIPGCDPSSMYILDRETGEEVFWVWGYFRPEVFAALIVEWCRAYNEAMVGVERENHGHAVLLEMSRLGYGRSHLLGGPVFFHRDEVVTGMTSKFVERSGWRTNESTRAIMLSQLAAEVAKMSTAFRDRALLDEFISFRLQANGRFEADSGQHDDRVMARAISLQMLYYRKASVGFDIHSPKPAN